MSLNETEPAYCGTSVDNFHTSYKNWHGYISLVVCIMGTGANILNIIVLTRHDMRSPTNAILTGLAVADLAVMLEYIPYTVHDYILIESLSREERLSFAWACYIKFHSIFTQVLHTISIWLTVTLAVWRFIAVAYPHKNRQWCNMKTTLITIITAYIVCVLIVTPSLYLVTAIAKFYEILNVYGKTVTSAPLSQYIIDYQESIHLLTDHVMWKDDDQTSYKHFIGNTTTTTTTTTTTEKSIIYEKSKDLHSTFFNATTNDEYMRNITVYRLYHSDLALRNKSVQHITFLIYSVLIKLIPCTALTILSIRLIMALLKAKRRRKKLTNNFTNTQKTTANGAKILSIVSMGSGSGSGSGSACRSASASASASANSSEPKMATTARLKTKTKAKTTCIKPIQKHQYKQNNLMEKEKQTDRTTRMLLAVLLLFLITEFPQGIMGLLNLILGDAFLMQCYLKFSDLMDILALINSSINFILYCSMSRQFRITFVLLFRPKFFDKWSPVALDDHTRSQGNGRWSNAAVDGGSCRTPNVNSNDSADEADNILLKKQRLVSKMI